MLPVIYNLILPPSDTLIPPPFLQNAEKTPSKGCSVQRTPSLADSMAEYYDARDVIVCENSENGEEESDESGLSDITTTSNSEPDEVHGERPPYITIQLWS